MHLLFDDYKLAKKKLLNICTKTLFLAFLQIFSGNAKLCGGTKACFKLLAIPDYFNVLYDKKKATPFVCIDED